jgi:large subunit ribosomal protein L22
MEARAESKNNRGSARKLRLVADLIRGKRVADAIALLQFSKKGSAELFEKTLKSAISNSKNKAEGIGEFVDVDDLYVKEVYVNEGPKLKRWRAAAQGRATPIHKGTAHVTVVVDKRD